MPGKVIGDVLTAAVPAVVGAGASIFGAKKSSDTAKNATKAQLAANDAALAYQREQDAKAEARQAQIDAEERAAWEAEQSRLAPSVLSRRHWPARLRAGSAFPLMSLAWATQSPIPAPVGTWALRSRLFLR